MSRKGITWQELKELIPTLNEEDIKLFQEVFGFLLIRYVPAENSNASSSMTNQTVNVLEHQNSQLGQTFIFFKHAGVKKAVKETIEALKNDQTRA